MTNSRDLSTLLLLLQFKLLQKKRKKYCAPEPCCCCPCSCSDPEPPSPGPIPTPQPTYTEISIPVPPTPGLSGLPTRVYFDIDDRFTAAQRQKIIDALSATLFNWSLHHTQKWNGGTNTGISQLASCSNTYTTRNFQPTWYRGSITNGRQAAEVAMDQITQMIKDNGFRRSPRAKISSSVSILPASSSSIILGLTALKQIQVPLSFIINPIQLDNVNISSSIHTGAMFHAWLHRAGFRDPKTTGNFISEASMCVMRGFQAKNPAVPDSSFYRFFD